MMSMKRIWRALWRRTGNNDLAQSRPMEVPRPPFSFRKAVCAKASTALSWLMVSYTSWKLGTPVSGSTSSSRIQLLASSFRQTSYRRLNWATAISVIPCSRIFAADCSNMSSVNVAPFRIGHRSSNNSVVILRHSRFMMPVEHATGGEFITNATRRHQRDTLRLKIIMRYARFLIRCLAPFGP